MKPEEKRVLIILVIVGAIIIGGLILWSNVNKKNNNNINHPVQSGTENTEQYVQKLEDGSKLNISDELRKSKILDGLEITNIQLKETGGITTLLADVENKTGIRTNEKIVKVDILDKDGNVITDLQGVIEAIAPGGKFQLNIAVLTDVANAYDFRISNK